MSNPFDEQDAPFLVLRNDEGQHALWPRHIAVPGGWVTVFEGDQRADCAAYIDSHWVDMRPRSLTEAA